MITNERATLTVSLSLSLSQGDSSWLEYSNEEDLIKLEVSDSIFYDLLTVIKVVIQMGDSEEVSSYINCLHLSPLLSSVVLFRFLGMFSGGRDGHAKEEICLTSHDIMERYKRRGNIFMFV